MSFVFFCFVLIWQSLNFSIVLGRKSFLLAIILAVISFSTSNILSHSLLACRVSSKKSGNRKGVPLYATSHIFLATFKIICDFWQFMLFQCRSLLTYPCWNWDSWICKVISVPRFGKFLASSSDRFPAPFPSFF